MDKGRHIPGHYLRFFGFISVLKLVKRIVEIEIAVIAMLDSEFFRPVFKGACEALFPRSGDEVFGELLFRQRTIEKAVEQFFEHAFNP